MEVICTTSCLVPQLPSQSCTLSSLSADQIEKIQGEDVGRTRRGQSGAPSWLAHPGLWWDQDRNLCSSKVLSFGAACYISFF